jgi:hypothetical protein
VLTFLLWLGIVIVAMCALLSALAIKYCDPLYLPWLLARDAHFRLCTRTRTHLSLFASRDFRLMPRVSGTVPSQYSQLSKLKSLYVLTVLSVN